MGVDFRLKQTEFAGFIRNPQAAPPLDVDGERMATYRELFFNNIISFLTSNFPVLHSLYDEQPWRQLAQDFYSQHRCQTPYFCEIAEEFIAYLQDQRQHTDDYPFLLELAHYEWVEMALAIAQEQPKFGGEDFASRVLEQPLALSPLAWPLVYQYPVQRICSEYLPIEAPEQATYLIVYRDGEDEVHFMQTTAFTFSLLQLIEQNPGTSGAWVLQQLAAAMPQLTPQQVLEFGGLTLQELAGKGILIPDNA